MMPGHAMTKGVCTPPSAGWESPGGHSGSDIKRSDQTGSPPGSVSIPASTNFWTSARRLVTACDQARASRILIVPDCRYASPFLRAWTFPAGVRGPVECSHGRWRSADARNRSRPAAVIPQRLVRLAFPEATRFGFFSFGFGLSFGSTFRPLTC